jgi:hypothetical protein
MSLHVATVSLRMSPKKLTNFRIDSELLDALEAIREREGVPVSEQVRRGILMWINSKGGTKSPSRSRRKRERKG